MTEEYREDSQIDLDQDNVATSNFDSEIGGGPYIEKIYSGDAVDLIPGSVEEVRLEGREGSYSPDAYMVMEDGEEVSMAVNLFSPIEHASIEGILESTYDDTTSATSKPAL